MTDSPDWGTVIRAIAPNATAAIVDGLCAAMPDIVERFEVDSPLRQAHFLGQVAQESDGFRALVEYASGDAYEGRADLGNVHKGDGRRYRGEGLIQLDDATESVFWTAGERPIPNARANGIPDGSGLFAGGKKLVYGLLGGTGVTAAANGPSSSNGANAPIPTVDPSTAIDTALRHGETAHSYYQRAITLAGDLGPVAVHFVAANPGLIVGAGAAAMFGCMMRTWEDSFGLRQEIEAFAKAGKPIVYIDPYADGSVRPWIGETAKVVAL